MTPLQSMLFEQGKAPPLISRRLGHTPIKTTADVRGHLFAGQQNEAARRFA